jgi:hypothetical protein
MTRARDLADGTFANDLTVDTDTLHVDSTNNRVGIGLVSPSRQLHIKGSASAVRLEDTDQAGVYHEIIENSGQLDIRADHGNTSTTGNMLLSTGGSEAARIDSSGRLLVYKSSSGLANHGVEHNFTANNGYLGVTSTSTTAYFNREDSDGTIVELRKDNAAVGSIGTAAGFVTIGKDDVGLRFHSTNNIIYPHNMTTNVPSDGVINLGSGTYRFNNLSLSGGVYLGGTGSANYLDDYEEGTWTPAYGSTTGSFGSITYDAITQAKYVKVGDVVHCYGRIRTDAVSVGTAGGDLTLTGLPFTGTSNGSLNIGFALSFNTNHPSGGYFGAGGTVVTLDYRSSSNGAISNSTPSDLGTGANNNYLFFSVTYST